MILSLFLFFIAFIVILCSVTKLTLRIRKREEDKLNEFKLNLEENYGIKFNHSYKLVSKKDGSVRYLRVFSISMSNKEVKAKCFFTTKRGEIGTWYDNIEFLYNIKDNYSIEDCGEWK